MDPLQGANFYEFNLTGTTFNQGDVSDADFRNSNIDEAAFPRYSWEYTVVNGVDFRGALGHFLNGNNVIQTNGLINAIDLSGQHTNLYIRNDIIQPVVTNSIYMTNISAITIVLDGTNWTSTIDCQNVSTAQLDGTLHLAFTDCTPTELEGHTFRLFEWNQNTRTGEFDAVTSDPELGVTWDTSKLYTDGTVRLSLVDSDGDNISDSWEETYFRSISNCVPTSLCSNRINTVRQAYIAGLNPNDPDDFFAVSNVWNVLGWNATSGRVYSVWWSTNLLEGFQPPWKRISCGR